MPASFRPNDDIRILPEGDRFRIARRLHHHLDIVEIGEHQLVPAFEDLEAESAPEIHQPLLRMAVKPLISLGPAQLDCRAHELEREARVAKLLAYRQPLDLGEIREVANADAARRLVADVTEQVRAREIVAV